MTRHGHSTGLRQRLDRPTRRRIGGAISAGTPEREGAATSARTALFVLIAVSTMLRLVLSANLDSLGNEAYYALYARNLDWGYFDHPPMVGFVAALGLKLAGVYPPSFSMRLGFIALAAGSTWLLARLTLRWFGEWAGFYAALALNATLYFGLASGTLAGPDGPLLFFWLLTLDQLAVALERPEQNAAWVATGFAWGAALLSKYHAALLPIGFLLFLIVTPTARRCLRLPGPYLALLEALAVFSPVIGWNASHDWASFSFQARRAGGFHGFQLGRLFEAVGGQLLELTPWIWFGVATVVVRLVRRPSRFWTAPEAFLLSQAVPTLALFLGVATFRRIMPHWTLIGVVALLPLLGRLWEAQAEANPGRVRRKLVVFAACPMLLGALAAVHAQTGLLGNGSGRLLGSGGALADPTLDAACWRQVAYQLERRGLLDDPKEFLFTADWRASAELANAVGRYIDVACYHRDARGFKYWSRPQDWEGRDGLFIERDQGVARAFDYAPWFTRIEPLAPIPVFRGGVQVETVRPYRCVRQKIPFAVGDSAPGPIRPTAPRRDRRDESESSTAAGRSAP